MENSSQIIFGPVNSRRLGASLGIDIVPRKACTFDCVYCEVGPTTVKTTERQTFVTLEQVKKALQDYLAKESTDHLDYITFAGSGEPTLNLAIGSMIHYIKSLDIAPVAVLTNGSLLSEPEVRDDLMEADLVVPSLDAATEKTFRKINHPVENLDLSRIIDGIDLFTKRFEGEVWLEIMFVKGVNDTFEEAQALSVIAGRIAPFKVQLTTLSRPSRTAKVKPVDFAFLIELSACFHGDVEIITHDVHRRIRPGRKLLLDQIKAMLRIRPVSIDDICKSVCIEELEVKLAIEELVNDHKLVEEEFEGKTYYYIDD